MAVEDHYVHVTTSRGHELVLLRFSDALKEVGDTDGLQVHRSHWVAKSFVDSLKRENGKVTLILKDQKRIPVSRTYADAVRAAFL
jgi:DNA-binding LytR/AlgR family response regulator